MKIKHCYMLKIIKELQGRVSWTALAILVKETSDTCQMCRILLFLLKCYWNYAYFTFFVILWLAELTSLIGISECVSWLYEASVFI